MRKESSQVRLWEVTEGEVVRAGVCLWMEMQDSKLQEEEDCKIKGN